uniref:Immunoglobulin domain-containing protein n=1 Tax=Xiphophorus maculatus TaxID=8083 RepID=A0A3B5PNZ2_XIPMA
NDNPGHFLLTYFHMFNPLISENHSITLEWTFTTKTQGSWRELFIYCSLLAPHKELIFYQVHEGVEIPESQDDQFSGRVQSDKDVLREGRIRLHVSRLRTEDSGLYQCQVNTEYGQGSASLQLNVKGKFNSKCNTQCNVKFMYLEHQIQTQGKDKRELVWRSKLSD